MMEKEPRNTRISKEEFQLALAHMEELFDQAMAYAHDDSEKNDKAHQLFEDIKKAQSAIELKQRYSALYEELERLSKFGGLKRDEDRQKLNEVLEKMAEFPPDVQGQ